MKIIKNIGPGLAFLNLLSEIKGFRKKALEARAAGDLKTELENIAICEQRAGDRLKEILGSDLHIEGSENLPKEGPFVVVANHQGFFDPVLLVAAMPGFPIGFISKDDLIKMPYVGKLIADMRGVFIARNNAREALKAINQGVENLEKGVCMAIFPEGTRSFGGDMNEFKKGSLKLATKAGVPVVPLAIEGSYRIFEKDGYLHPDRVNVKILKTIETKNLEKTEANNLAEIIEAQIKEEVNRFKGERNE